MSRIGTIARRSFLLGSLAIAGGVAFGWWKYRTPYANPLLGEVPEGGATLNPWVLIDATGVTIIAPRAEMGQGVHTTLAALVAEEMDLDWAQVKVIHGPASAAYYNAAVMEEGVPFAPTDDSATATFARGAMRVPAKFLGFQITGGSSSVPDAYEKMRLAGAAARIALVQAAATRLNLPADQLKTEGGAVIAPDGTRLAYTELAVDAAKVEVTQDPPLKPRDQWKLLGTSLPRTDMLAKVTGTATFTADIRLPGMLFATARTNPGLGGAMRGFDASVAEGMPGVVEVVPLPNGAAVVARTTWQAMNAAAAIAFDWGPAPYAADSAAILADLSASFTPDRLDSTNRDDGDTESALGQSVSFEASYSVPYLAHATMEPMTAGAWLKEGKLQVWAGNQLPTQILKVGAQLTGLPEDSVSVETPFMGGGFGRRAEMDIIAQAVTVAKAMDGTPVLLTWTREEDMTHDAYRPAAQARIRARLDGSTLTALDVETCASSVIEGQIGRLGYSIPGPDSTIVQGAADQPYALPNFRVRGYRAPAMLPVGSWRSVGCSQNAFFMESAIDELAHQAGVDPLDFRLSALTHDPSRKVLEKLAEISNWGTNTPGRAKGLAFVIAFGVPTAQVIEVEQTDRGLRLTGAWAVVDVGVALDPRNIEAQVSGGMVYGLSAAMRGEITVAEGKVEQQTFWDFDPLRLPQMPPVTVAVLENMPRIRGIGEPGTPPAAPALANAIFALTGQRLRDLPLAKSVTFA